VNDGRKLSAIAASAKHDVTIACCQDHVTFLLTKKQLLEFAATTSSAIAASKHKLWKGGAPCIPRLY
jgi:hypothetical protein